MSAAAGGGVLDAIAKAILRTHPESEAAAELEKASAAVAELIAADKEYDEARTAYESADWPEVPRQQKEQAGARLVAARTRRAAALSNIEGGQ